MKTQVTLTPPTVTTRVHPLAIQPEGGDLVVPDHNITVVGASAGGVEALTELVKNLPKEF